MHHHDNNLHNPVLLAEVLQYLDPKRGETYVDFTAGYGGHAQAIVDRTHNEAGTVLVDRDHNAITELAKHCSKSTRLVHDNFLNAAIALQTEGFTADLILADLGLSSPHLDNASRGFAIAGNGPLDMRMDSRQEITAADVVNTYSEAELTNILRNYGEEPKAKQIARLIVENRPLATTEALAQLAARVWPRGSSRVHPATRTFQAIRIAVNDELSLLERAIPIWLELLKPGGRIAIISFHSLEDRIVKQAFALEAGDRYDATLKLLTKQPVTGSQPELVSNPRARSAKLRAAAKK